MMRTEVIAYELSIKDSFARVLQDLNLNGGYAYFGAHATVPCRESGLEDSAFLSWDPLYTDPAPVEFSHSLM